MNILITGVAGFIGFSLAKHLLNHSNKIKIYGIDNLDDYYDDYDEFDNEEQY